MLAPTGLHEPAATICQKGRNLLVWRRNVAKKLKEQQLPLNRSLEKQEPGQPSVFTDTSESRYSRQHARLIFLRGISATVCSSRPNSKPLSASTHTALWSSEISGCVSYVGKAGGPRCGTDGSFRVGSCLVVECCCTVHRAGSCSHCD